MKDWLDYSNWAILLDLNWSVNKNGRPKGKNSLGIGTVGSKSEQGAFLKQRVRFTSQMNLKIVLVWAVFCFASGGLMQSANASCGLDYCPLTIKDEASEPILQLRLVPRLSSFSNRGIEGHYVENIIRGEFLAIDKWRFGGWIAPIVLDTEDFQTTGLSNPVFFAERVLYNPKHFQFRGALQVEVPLGSSSDGLASSHSELLPYVSLSTSIGNIQIHGQFGVAIGLEGGTHGHDVETSSLSQEDDRKDSDAPSLHDEPLLHDTPLVSDDSQDEDSNLLVNPHAPQEILSRLAIMGHMWHGLLSPGVHINGRHAIQRSNVNDVVSINGVVLLNLSKRLSVIAQFEVPFNENPRFNWRTGFGVDLKL